jgi:hypothetical protein
MKRSNVSGLTREALTDAGVVRSGNTLTDARKQADTNECAVIYPGPYGHRVAMPGDSRTGNLNVEFWGKFDEVVEALKIAGIGFELVGEA